MTKGPWPASPERRRFLAAAGRYGFTAAAVAGAAGLLGSREAAAQLMREDGERQRSAEIQMVLATEYMLGASRSYPIMELDFKDNIQNMTRGKVYVRLAPAGQLGAGSALAQAVQEGTVHAAMFSLSNFAPFAPVVDLVNIPFWCGDNQQYANLVNSAVWSQEVTPKVEAKSFKPLWYVCIDPRTVSLRRGLKGPARTPDDIEGIKFRVPGSKILQQFYRLAGANPTPIAWGETSSAIQQGVADALDPAAGALFVFGFKELLSSITFVRSVPDAQVYACNRRWHDELPPDVKAGLARASEVTSRQNLAKVPSARAYATAELGRAGVQFHAPNEDEHAAWVERCGHQRPEWEPVKVELAGSLAVFDKLREAADAPSGWYVHDA